VQFSGLDAAEARTFAERWLPAWTRSAAFTSPRDTSSICIAAIAANWLIVPLPA